MIVRFKKSGRYLDVAPLIRLLGHSLRAHYQEASWPAAIIPVPLHWRKLQQRGFNQAALIAQSLARITPCPVRYNTVKRTKTISQQGLSARQRNRNVRGTFKLVKPLDCTHVALVDDVMTTGSTLEELCRLLKRNGVLSVDVWCLARAQAHTS